ncbi:MULTISPECIES: hypothetical protein [unclassified Leclercia]|uniref:hypothetical protein n=1 Tax=unclassified Leclercia TaxID=2627398 RepID=UPI0012E76ABB|nr:MULTISPECIES: hypothetical protein [unclassified Leclercia]QGW17526.1 hypothetical protein GNG29_13610 [Leclercia sp. Colony189]
MSISKHELLGAPKHANQHRLSRLTMESHTDELRIMASAVENYTDELIAALEAAEKRIAEQQKSRERALTLLEGATPENSWETIARLKVVIGGDYRSQAEIDAAGISIKEE